MKPYYQDEWVTIYLGDCRLILPELPKVDLVLTSPPYDDLREYGGDTFDYNVAIDSIIPVIGLGSVCVWVVGDAVIKGSETGSSFRQALRFIDGGLLLHDTMVYEKNGAAYPANDKSNRYTQIFEYMFVFSNGRPKTTNLIKDKPNNWAGSGTFGQNSERQRNGEIKKRGRFIVPSHSIRNNIWRINNGYGYSASDDIAYKHPAIFPEQLARDHIISWTNSGDLVLDPFLGSGTTAYCAKKLNRKCIGIEIEEKYCEIAAKRCSQSVFNLAIKE